jgi:hypothetical protein
LTFGNLFSIFICENFQNRSSSMFKFKKIALLGAAGLAAFSMSCSDSDSGSAGGDWTTAFNAEFDYDAKRVTLSGVVTAEGDNQITALTVTADGNVLPMTQIYNANNTAFTLPASATTLTLTGIKVAELCGDKTAPTTFKIGVTVTFSGDEPLSGGPIDVTVPCAPSGLAIYEFTLSSGGESYVDLDGLKTHKQATATARITDIIAFPSRANCSEGLLCAPWAIADWASDLDETARLISIPASAQAAAKLVLDSPTKTSLQAFLGSADADALFDAADAENGGWGASINIAENVGNWFIVESGGTSATIYNGKEFAVKIVSANVSAKTVTLRALYIE